MRIVKRIEAGIHEYLNYFIAHDKSVSEKQKTYEKNIAGVSLVAAGGVPVFALLYIIMGLDLSAAGILVGGAGIMLSPHLLKVTGSPIISRSTAILSLYSIFIIICFSMHGVKSACAYWFITIPAAAVFMGGFIPGVFWLLVSAASVSAMHYYEVSGGTFMNLDASNPLFLQTSSIIGLICVITSLAILFDNSKNHSFRQLKKAKTELEKTADELKDLISEISGAILRIKKETGIISEKTSLMAKSSVTQEKLLEISSLTMKDIAVHTQNNTENAGIAKSMVISVENLAISCEQIMRNQILHMIEVSTLSDKVIDTLNQLREIRDRNKGAFIIDNSDKEIKSRICCISRDIAEISRITSQGRAESLNSTQAMTELLSSSRKVTRLVSQVYLNSHQQALSNEIAASGIGSINASAHQISSSAIEIAASIKSLNESVSNLENFIHEIAGNSGQKTTSASCLCHEETMSH